MDMPQFTPLPRRAPPSRLQRMSLVASSVPDSSTIPPTLLAPRYSHLMEEAIAISGPTTSTAKDDHDTPDTTNDPVTPASPRQEPEQPSSLGKRVKGFLFSYLPIRSGPSTGPPLRKPSQQLRGLPLPPDDILKRPRGPVTTPIRPPPTKPRHPKELVDLHPAPLPVKTSLIPRVAKPQRMVQLNPVPERPASVIGGSLNGSRRSSGGSVKDLVKNFEELDGRVSREQNHMRRAKSNGDLKGLVRPSWKP